MCYYFAMQHLSYHNPNPWPVFIKRNDLNTGLFKNLSGGGVGIYKKGPYYTECGEMTDGCWLLVTKGLVWYHMY
jgi:hypothetical protein